MIHKDDIAAITSRMDAAMVVMIELTAEAHGMNVNRANSKYTQRYDELAKQFRKEMVD
jgi:DNA-binding FrmR family transcriptional regulator